MTRRYAHLRIYTNLSIIVFLQIILLRPLLGMAGRYVDRERYFFNIQENASVETPKASNLDNPKQALP